MKVSRMNKSSALFVITICGLISSTHCATPTFKENAGDFMFVGYKMIVRRGEENKDFSKLEIEARPLLMVDNKEVIEKDDITVEVKAGDDEWEVVTKPPSKRGGVYKWTVPNVTPCVEHNVRLWLRTMDGIKSSFTYPHPTPAANIDEITASGYRPEKPKDVVVSHYSEGDIKVSWTKSECATLYDVTYQNIVDGKTASEQTDTELNSVIISDNIAYCSEYEIRVTALIGDEYSEESIVAFSTQPTQDAIEIVKPILQSTDNSVIAKWKGFEKLSCITEYLVSVCKDDEECITSEKVKRDDSLQFIEYKSPEILDECTEYIINITPMHSQLKMSSKILKFRTKAHKVENMANLVSLEDFQVDDQQIITLQWSPIKCANHYEVFKKVNIHDENWERIGVTEESFIKNKGLPCTEYKYGVKVTIDDHESDIVEFDEMIKVDPVLSHPNHLSLVVEERANDSVTFVINSGDINKNCKVEKYHIKHNSEETFIDPLSLEDGKIRLKNQPSGEIQGRIKFHGFEPWAPWISSDSPLKEKQRNNDVIVILPIIIGAVVIILLVSLLVFCIIRTKKDQMKYDEEKSQGITEESKKLNKQMEELINGDKR